MKTSLPGAIAAVCWFIALGAWQGVYGQNTEFVDENGIRYQVTRTVVPRPIPVTKTEDRQITTYRQQVTTENVPHQQVYRVPVTQYQVVPRLHGRWNPFIEPYWTYEYQPVTVWQEQVATVQIPVTRSTWTPDTQTVPQQVTKWETHNQEIVTKTPLGPSPAGGGGNMALAARPLSGSTPSATVAPAPTGAGATAVAAAQQYGGQALQGDPPKSGWQPLPGAGVPSTATTNGGSRY
ncbi:MAG: hypothetical protein DCC67_08935 [Planctomycetota bacterium]|nr:MAG: hypothetical protein DCC67_08935 [Planctomycetota bacterium]